MRSQFLQNFKPHCQTCDFFLPFFCLKTSDLHNVQIPLDVSCEQAREGEEAKFIYISLIEY